MKKTKIILLTLLSLSCLNSKRQEIKKHKVTGNWMIDEIYYKDKSVKDSLSYNMLFFKDISQKNIIKIPEFMGFDAQSSMWKIDKEQLLCIDSKNDFFNGVYKIEFFKEEKRKLLGAVFKNNDMKIIAYKLHQDYIIDGFNW